jgi:plastocyanin domain-containing protein
MTFIELASICFGLAAAISLLTGLVEVIMSEKNNPADWQLVTKSLVTGFALSGVALWSWRLSEGASAFAEALK